MLELADGAVDFLRRRIAGMFPGRHIDAKLIAENIAFGAAVLGAGHVELVDRGGWWFVASEFNWLAASNAHDKEVELFETILPFPEQSPTGHRAEIYVTAFAEAAYFRIGDAVTWLRGEATEEVLPDRGVVPAWCTKVLAFRCRERSG
ncbi:MAG: hypothetical protein F4029_01785 [Gammaproteobacteria bacterium]|nr:hypothetical protein [Gammaproteobacteria bacterium]MYF27952.1 hypothetical protein [Gammaproteobacteria bacterium]MYK44939.1 hypothetical protein [Gammaproteobacteria bacterium]